MKQTAIEWFFEQLTEVDYNCINKTFLQNDKSLAGYKIRELFEQAKEMEKEQICDAHIAGFYSEPFGKKSRSGEAEQYYNETFKSE
jgi:hypothetical protein